MQDDTDVIKGAVKIEGFLDDYCFTSWKAFVADLAKFLSVELPSNITNVTVGNVQPGDDERDNLWVRLDNSGSFLGLYVYVQGAWQKVYPADNQIFLVPGDSRVVQKGYQLASDSPLLDADVIAKLQLQWVQGSPGPDLWYKLFHVVFVGF